jgi:hypothetical protein
MNEELLNKIDLIAKSLERIAICLENKQMREIVENKKKILESKKNKPK